MEKMKNILSYFILGAVMLGVISSCTDLEDEVIDRPVGIPEGGSSASLNSVYSQLNALTDQANTYALEEHSSDEMMGPTRGTDWDDFGTWRRLHQHTWDASHNQVTDTWDILNIGVFRATEVISASTGNTNTVAQARFLRAFFMFYIVDLYGQVPIREATESFDIVPRVLSRTEATAYIIDDLNFAVANLGSDSPGRATKEAAQFLLAKVYLNRAVYTQNPQQPAGPFTFSPADMNNVIANCDAIINSGKFSLEPKGEYFDNFHWENSTRSKELIFVIENTSGSPVGNVQNRYRMTMHYNQNPDGWNGFTTLADFYNSFEAQDERRGGPYPGVTDQLGYNAGFLVGQQFGPGNVPLKTRGGNPLIFTPNLNLLYSDESVGIRVIKYLPEPGNFNNQGTDYVFFRYADVLLMKAEAALRGGTGGSAVGLTLVNQLKAARGAAPLAALNETALLAERGRELYWEGWRRNDMIRFNTFLNPMDQKPQPTPDYRVVYPIPQRALDTNPNLKQNFGY